MSHSLRTLKEENEVHRTGAAHHLPVIKSCRSICYNRCILCAGSLREACIFCQNWTLKLMPGPGLISFSFGSFLTSEEADSNLAFGALVTSSTDHFDVSIFVCFLIIFITIYKLFTFFIDLCIVGRSFHTFSNWVHRHNTLFITSFQGTFIRTEVPPFLTSRVIFSFYIYLKLFISTARREVFFNCKDSLTFI